MASAKLRLNPLSQKEIEIQYNQGDSLQDIYEGAFRSLELPHRKELDEYIVIKVDGYDIDKEYWKYTKPKEDVNVLIAVIPKGGNFGQIFKTVVVLAAVVVTTVLTAGGAAAAWAPALVGFAATLAMNALIPPLKPGLGGGGFSSEGYDSSQTYSISNQSNSVNKYGPIPRIYGRHKMFPTIAANPYTEIEADPNTGELVQYFYCVYDFGFGPLAIEDLRIGDTSITDYTNVTTRLVDFNKPAISEGFWDDELSDSLALYKGDVTQSSVSVTLNSNQSDTGSTPDQYQAVRSASTNTGANKQELTVTVGFPQGLNTVNTSGNREPRNVELRLEFAEVGTEDWRDFDDYLYVDDFEEPVSQYGSLYMPTDSWDDSPSDSIAYINTAYYNAYENPKGIPDSFLEITSTIVDGETVRVRDENYTFEIEYYGIKAGVTSRIPLTDVLGIGQSLYVKGEKLGTVTTIDAVSPTFYWHNFPVASFDKPIFHRIKKTNLNTLVETFYFPDFNTLTGSGESAFTGKASDGGVKVITGNQTNLLYATFRFIPKTTASIKLRLTRLRSYGGATFQVFDAMVWSTLTTRFDTNPIATTQRHTFLEIRIKATDQINGTIQTLNGVATSVLDTWDGTQWVKAPTSNPAWIYTDLLTGSVNKRALDKSRLDIDSIYSWSQYCDEIPTTPPNLDHYDKERFRCNFIMDYNIVLSDAIQQVVSMAQASMNLIDGKYGVLIDREKNTPVQIFTPRNSWDFYSNRKYVQVPNALKIKYTDEGANWEQRERIVYDDGFDSLTATTFEDIDTFGVTNEEQAYRYGRYMIAQGRLRQENITITVDFEHLVCTRGDYVLITQDAMRVGGTPARVSAVSGSDITIDADFATEPLTNYGYTYRNASGIVTNTMTVTSPNTATLDGAVPNVGDLIVWGEVDLITYECIVKAISPNDDLTATLALVEKNNAIYLAESSENIPLYTPRLSTVQDTNLTPPSEVQNLTVDDNSFDCDGTQYVYFIDLIWDAPASAIFEIFEVYVDYGKGYELADYTNQLNYRFIVDQDNLGLNHDFKIIAVSSTGSKLSLGEVTAVSATPVSKTSPPSNVEDLFINITNETLTLDWPKVTDCDVLRYFIRYSPSLTAEWEQSIPLTDVDPNTLSTTTQARTGSYFIKAVDFNLNESSSAAVAITSIPELFNLNIIEETNDFPAFPGTFIKTTTLNNELILADEVSGPPGVQQFWAEGEYLYSQFLDLGEIYTVRLQSLIEAEGYTTGDIIANWTTLASVTQMSSVAVSEWDVETYYRGRDVPFSMSTWVTLDSIDPISEGDQDDWTPWRKFTIGDFTFRIGQFKLVLKSNQASVSPRVFDAKIRSDMPDRVYEENNVIIPVTGATITYSPAFAGPSPSPNVQITIDDAQSGDYYEFTNKTLEGFDIIIKDKTDTAVERQIDLAVKGYGRKTTATI